MDKITAGQVDISAILNTYVYMDEQNSNYQNKSLSWILDNMPDSIKKTGDYKAVLNAINENPELGKIKLVSQSTCSGIDEKLVIACAFQDANGDMYIAYRGTGDGKWVDNGYGIANESSQMQRVANDYFDKCVEDLGLTNYDQGKIFITGHSKGGNEAQYVILNSKYGYLIDRCYSLDGQGFSEEAIEHFIEQYGLDYYESQLQKMYSINGENDYVHDLGIPVIPKENTYFVETPDANSIGGYHDIKEMLNGPGLNWYDENGNIVTVDQGPIGQFARVISEKMSQLDQEDLEDCAITVMSLLEYLMPYKDENGKDVLGGNFKFGTGDKKFMTIEEFMGFLDHGIPLLAKTLFTTEEGLDLVFDLIKSGIKLVYDKAGVFGVLGVLVVAPLLISKVVDFTVVLNIIGRVSDYVTDFIDSIVDLSRNIKKWFSELKESINVLINKIKTKVVSLTSGYKYATANPQIVVDTYKLNNYAQRLQKINGRITKLDRRLDNLYWRVGLLDLWKLMQADALTGYSWRLSRCASYLYETASTFEIAESAISNNL